MYLGVSQLANWNWVFELHALYFKSWFWTFDLILCIWNPYCVLEIWFGLFLLKLCIWTPYAVYLKFGFEHFELILCIWNHNVYVEHFRAHTVYFELASYYWTYIYPPPVSPYWDGHSELRRRRVDWAGFLVILSLPGVRRLGLLSARRFAHVCCCFFDVCNVAALVSVWLKSPVL